MAELRDFIAFGVKGLYCKVVGHRWLELPPNRGDIIIGRICLRCLTREWRDQDD